MCHSAQVGFHKHHIWVFHCLILYEGSSQALSEWIGIETEPHMKTIQCATHTGSYENYMELKSNDISRILPE